MSHAICHSKIKTIAHPVQKIQKTNVCCSTKVTYQGWGVAKIDLDLVLVFATPTHKADTPKSISPFFMEIIRTLFLSLPSPSSVRYTNMNRVRIEQ